MKHISRWGAVAAAGLVLSVAACAGGEAIGSGVTVRDSAGVEIVENTTPAWNDDSAWKLSDVPAVDIGVLEGPQEYQLFQARDAKRLSDGRIVVVNGGTNELRFYGADGTYLSSAGREGSGPGEFQQMGWLRSFSGDSLAVYDFSLGRLSVFDAAGTFARSFKIAPLGESGFVIAVDIFADGAVLAKSPLIFAGGAIENGLNRRDELYEVHGPNGELLDSLGAFPGPEQYIRSGGSANRRWVSLISLPFGRSPTAAVEGSRFCYGASDEYQIACYDRDGALRRVVRRSVAARAVTQADLEAFKEQQMEGLDDDGRREMERSYAEMPIPQTMPAYATFIFDRAGNLWVRAFTVGTAATWPWTVFDPQGRMLGTVTMPADFRVTQIGDDFVLGVRRDDLEVEHVLLYRLARD